MTSVPHPARLALLGVLLLSACAPRDLESPPVTVATAQGPVLCQLYTEGIVYWDRSIDRPDSMSAAQADAICLEEGQRLAARTSG
ncbi:hypothetical protein JL811_17585 [Tabrizicola sp. DMG-N-6]|uniref:Uncharacterized protein n=2 Tax=Szabonella alba TaxID=2804194 RepID=A0A8K0Y257_9RHOB|nr:hypothetical protein [Szabonella alba]